MSGTPRRRDSWCSISGSSCTIAVPANAPDSSSGSPSMLTARSAGPASGSGRARGDLGVELVAVGDELLGELVNGHLARQEACVDRPERVRAAPEVDHVSLAHPRLRLTGTGPAGQRDDPGRH